MSKKEKLFQVPASITKLETMGDGGIRVVLDTQEITDPKQLTDLFTMRKGAEGWFLFKEAKFTHDDIPDYEPQGSDGPERKSPSQRLRAVMWLYFTKAKGGKPEAFDGWYDAWYEKQIEAWKEKLPPRSEE